MPTINGEPAATQPGPSVAAGDPIQMLVTVTNTGSGTVDHLSVSTSAGTAACGATTLTSDQSTTCVMDATANSGVQTITGVAQAVRGDVGPVVSTFAAYYAAGPDPDGQSPAGPGVEQPPATGGDTPGTAGPPEGPTGDKGTIPVPPGEVPTGSAIPEPANQRDGLPAVLAVMALALAGLYITGRAVRRFPS